MAVPVAVTKLVRTPRHSGRQAEDQASYILEFVVPTLEHGAVVKSTVRHGKGGAFVSALFVLSMFH